MCTHTNMHTHTGTAHTCTHVHMHAHTCAPACAHTHAHIRRGTTHKCTHMHRGVRVHALMHTCARMHTHVHSHMYVTHANTCLHCALHTCNAAHTHTHVHARTCTHACTPPTGAPPLALTLQRAQEEDLWRLLPAPASQTQAPPTRSFFIWGC